MGSWQCWDGVQSVQGNIDHSCSVHMHSIDLSKLNVGVVKAHEHVTGHGILLTFREGWGSQYRQKILHSIYFMHVSHVKCFCYHAIWFLGHELAIICAGSCEHMISAASFEKVRWMYSNIRKFTWPITRQS